MTNFQGWIIVAELALLILVVVGPGFPATGRRPKTIEMEITKIGDGFVHGRGRDGRFYAVDMSRIIVGERSPKVGDLVTFS